MYSFIKVFNRILTKNKTRRINSQNLKIQRLKDIKYRVCMVIVTYLPGGTVRTIENLNRYKLICPREIIKKCTV